MGLSHTVLVALSGAIGAVLRYAVGLWVGRIATNSLLPWPTLSVNLIGCLLIGLVAGYELRHGLSESWRLLLITGFCGGYTTYSAFALENLHLLHQGAYLPLMAYMLLSLIGGIALVALGIYLVRLLC